MKKKIKISNLRQSIPYIISGVIILGIIFLGSSYKNDRSETLSLNTFSSSNYNISTDQMAEMYVVADISSAINLASSEDLAYNYVSATSLYKTGQSTTDKIEKPTVIDVSSISRGIEQYTVKEGDTMETIAKNYGLTTDQIRWSNGLKTTDISVGDVLYLTKNVSGIVYTVKEGDTIDSIAETYGSTAAEITYLNNLDTTGLKEGDKIAIQGGTLPEKERPEYVAPRTVSSYTTLGNSGIRENIEVVGWFYNLGGPYASGQCTQWAWYKRGGVPSSWGNANTWASRAASEGYQVDRTPAAGAIFQTSSGYYGHVGYVEAVNDDGSIVVSEMNYGYIPYRAIRSTIPARYVDSFWYIH